MQPPPGESLLGYDVIMMSWLPSLQVVDCIRGGGRLKKILVIDWETEEEMQKRVSQHHMTVT